MLNYRSTLWKKEPAKKGKCIDDSLYPISILNEDEQDSKGHVKIHYEGFGSEYDEWKDPTELINIATPYVSETYDLHQDLALRIKSALMGTRKSNPCVRISLPFGTVESA